MVSQSEVDKWFPQLGVFLGVYEVLVDIKLPSWEGRLLERPK